MSHVIRRYGHRATGGYPTWSRLARLWRWLVDGLAALGTMLIGVLMLIICADIVARNLPGLFPAARLRARRPDAGHDRLSAARRDHPGGPSRPHRNVLLRVPANAIRGQALFWRRSSTSSGPAGRPDCLVHAAHPGKGLRFGRVHRRTRHRHVADLAVPGPDPGRHDGCGPRILSVRAAFGICADAATGRRP